MNLFDVYPRFDIEPVRGEGVWIWDRNDQKYLDMYGGHAVISIGHNHPVYVRRITEQIKRIGFYSNSVQMPIQETLAGQLGRMSGYPDFSLFLTNSGAEANENALKLASFYNGRQRVIAFRRGFHGRTGAAIQVTDNPKIRAPYNETHNVDFLALNDSDSLRRSFTGTPVCAVIVEGIQGVGGVRAPTAEFLQEIRRCCDAHDAVFILDEVQSGYGRSGRFFAHQHANIQPDLITVAKGMGNGFPIGGVLIHPRFKSWPGMLGTTFGGNHLACAAGLAVLEVIEDEQLLENARSVGEFLLSNLSGLPAPVHEVRGQGLMIGIDLGDECMSIRKALLFQQHVLTGISGNETLRLLPPLGLSKAHATLFLEAFSESLESYSKRD